MSAPTALRSLLCSLLLAATAACDKPIAIGEGNRIVLGAPDSVWARLEDDIAAALEPQVFTVRDERILEVSPIDPTGPDWADLKHLRQVLVVGEPADPWIAPVLEEVEGAVGRPPTIVQARNVWAQNQVVTAIVLPAGAGPEAARPLIPEVGRLLIQQFENYARGRMYVTGADTTIADSLRRLHGFSLLAPRVYSISSPAPDVVVFRNANPDPSQLIREVDVASRPNEEVELTPEAALEWRSQLAARVTDPSQVTETEIAGSRRLTVAGRPAIEIQGVWANPPGEWPAAGPYIARLVQCPERTYLLNAWLYAPGSAKYEYLIQLETLLNTFRCGAP